MTLFEIATRENYTFKTDKGVLNITQLWKLPLTSARGPSLQSVAVGLNRTIVDSGEEQFVSSSPLSQEVKLARNKLNVVKRIIEVREAENAEKTMAAKKATEKQRLQELLAHKKMESMQNLSIEEIEAKLKEL